MRAFLHLLGHPYADLTGTRAELPTTKPTCLLLYLACRGDWASRDELAELFRPEADEATARHGLRLLLSRAKQFSWAQGLEVEPQRLRWTPPSDVISFREALERGDWGAATALYRGPLLTGFTVRDTLGFEDFVALERRALESAWREAALHHAHDLEDAQPQEAAALLARVLAEDLLAEDAVQRYLRLSHRTGAREEALRVFAAFRDRLEDELGLAPLEETEALAALVRRAERVEVQPGKPATKSVPLAVQHPPRVVGRDAVRAALTDTRLPVALLAGEPGVGKTRLLEEVAPRAVWLRCREGLSDVPYFPLLSWLRDEVESLPALEPAYLDELARLVPERAPGRLPPPFDPLLGRSRLLEAFAQLFAAVGGNNTLVFDDLQWADAATVELLLYLAERGDLRILGSYRSTETSEALQRALSGLRSNGRLESLELAPLTPEDVTDFVASLSGQPEGPPLFSRWLHARTGGNPFFILETLKALFENGLMREQDRHWHTELDNLTRDYSELEVPHRVAETVRRRVSSLSEPSKRVLGVAAVVREGFTPELLSALTGLSTWAVLDVLEEAGRVGLLRGAAFGHDLVRQSLYENIGAERRKRLHARAAEVLISTANPAVNSTVNPAVVAEHYFLGGDAERAAAFWLTAARRLSAQHLPDLAAALLEDKVKFVDAPWLERLQAELAETYMVLGHYEQARGVAQTALRPSADVQAQAHACLIKANLAFNAGNLEKTEAFLNKAQEFDAGRDETFGKKFAETQCVLLHARGRFEEALTLIGPYLKRESSDAEHLNMVINAASLLDCLERHEEALALHKQAWSLVADAGSCFYRVNAASNLLACYIDLGRQEEGVAIAEAALATCGDYPNIAAMYLRNNLAAAYRRLGRLEKAVALYETITQGELTTPVQFVALSSLARLYHKLGDTAACYRELERALDALPTTEMPAAKGRVYVVTLAVGTESQKARIQEELAAFDLTTLPPDVREELRGLLND